MTKQKASVIIEKMRSVALLILAVATRAADGETRVFLVSGIGDNNFNRLYAEYEYYHAEGDQQALDGWHLGDIGLSVRVQQLSLVSTLRQTEAERGSFTVDGRLVCKVANPPYYDTNGDWAHLPSERICDKNVDCQNKMDEKVTTCFDKEIDRTQAIILNGVGSRLAGVYYKNHWEWDWGDRAEFYSRTGKLGFIYQPAKKHGLVIGTGETIRSPTAVYRWSEGEKVWKYVEDGSLAGRSNGTTASEVQLTEIPDEIDLSLFENNTLLEEETTIPGVDNATGPLGIICLSPKKKEKTFIAFNDTAAGWYCDKTWHCQLGGAFEIHFIKVVINDNITIAIIAPFPILGLRTREKSVQPLAFLFVPENGHF